MLQGGLVFFGVLVVAIGIGIGIGAWIAPTSPVTTAKSLVSDSISAATSAGSFHYVELSTNDGQPYDITGDAGSTSGRQVITQIGSNGTDVFDLRLVDGTVYFRGNKAALVDQLGVTSTQASSLTGTWISVKKGATVYKKFESGITDASNLSQIPKTFVASRTASMPGTSPATTRVVGGLYDGKGKAPIGSASLVVDSSSHLPQTLHGTVSASDERYTLTWTFTHFGERVHVKAPSKPVAFSSLHAHPPATNG